VVARFQRAWSEEVDGGARTNGFSIAKRDIPRIYVDDENAKSFEKRQDGLDLFPPSAELFLLFRAPVIQDFLGEIGRPVEIGPAKIEDKRTGHDCHCDHAQFIVVRNQFRDVAAAYSGYPTLFQTRIRISLSAVVRLLLVNLERQSTSSAWLMAL